MTQKNDGNGTMGDDDGDNGDGAAGMVWDLGRGGWTTATA